MFRAAPRGTFRRLAPALNRQWTSECPSVVDKIQLGTFQGNFKYEAASLTVVEPENVAVLAASEDNVLTLVTCYPFDYIGPAPGDGSSGQDRCHPYQ